MGSNVRRKKIRQLVNNLRQARPDTNITVENVTKQLKEKK